MRVNIGDKTIVIGWKYTEAKNQLLSSVDTVCTISEVQADNTLSEIVQGIASCSHTDAFRKEPGRKLSLQRAVLTKTPDKYGKWNYIFQEDDRVKIWQQYFLSRNADLPKELVR